MSYFCRRIPIIEPAADGTNQGIQAVCHKLCVLLLPTLQQRSRLLYRPNHITSAR